MSKGKRQAGSSGLTRRSALRAAGGMGATFVLSCDDQGGGTSEDAGAAPARGDGGMAGPTDASPADVTDETPPACTLYPEQVEGPFYLDDDLVRQDITEGKAGQPLTLIMRVVRAGSCAALAGVAVDVWHCDADGVYSGFSGQLGGLDTRGQTFLRGTQLTDAQGEVRFVTIYPGWYPGRTTHIHFKVRPSAGKEAISQIYFPEHVNAAVYAMPAYEQRGPKDTPNLRDGAVRSTHLPPLPDMSVEEPAFVARLTIAVAM